MAAVSARTAAFHAYIDGLQATLTKTLADLDGTPFTFEAWQRREGGGGRMAMLRGGRILEKGACHVSKVHGGSNPLTGRPFHAAGLSLILHPANPHAPAVHLNVRRFEQEDTSWWGGGMDLTPMGVRHEEDVRAFHAVLQERLGHRYESGRLQAERYFQVPHRGRARGAGGVFFDHVADDEGAALVRDIGDAFLPAYVPMLERRAAQPFGPVDRQAQERDRGVYVEFNLLYDRGTRFGLESGGNVEAILSSLPPVARW
jgi:coproporphyrinogen III oxidase